MAKKLTIQSNSETVNPMIDMFNHTGETANEFFGALKKIKFELKGDGFSVDFTKAVPKLSGFDSRIRKPLMRYETKYKLIDDSNIEITVMRGKTKILTTAVQDKKKYKSVSKEVLTAILEDAGSQAGYYVEIAANTIASDMKALESQGRLSGVFYNLPEIGYHLCPGISKSKLVHIQKSYNHFRYASENPSSPTETMKLGSLVHLKVLEPKRYKDTVVVMDIDKRTNEGKLQALLNEIIHAGKTVISSDQEARILVMEKNLRAHPVISRIFAESKFEVSIFWENDLGSLSRGRLDGVVEKPSKSLASLLSQVLPYSEEDILESVVVWDVKTADSAEENDFSRAAYNRGYHIQAGSYSSGAKQIYGKKVIFVFIVVENRAPYQVDFQVLDPMDMQLGLDTYVKLLSKLEEHTKNPKLWGGYTIPKKRFLQLPRYAHYDAEDMDAAGNEE